MASTSKIMKKKNVNIFRLRQLWEKWLTVGMVVAIVTTTAALAPAIVPSTYSFLKENTIRISLYSKIKIWEVLKGALSYHLVVCIIIALFHMALKTSNSSFRSVKLSV